jgi:hypothetical protein
MAVARELWQPIAGSMPASAARRRIVRSASQRVMRSSGSVLGFPAAVRKSGLCLSPAKPAEARSAPTNSSTFW